MCSDVAYFYSYVYYFLGFLDNLVKLMIFLGLMNSELTSFYCAVQFAVLEPSKTYYGCSYDITPQLYQIRCKDLKIAGLGGLVKCA